MEEEETLKYNDEEEEYFQSKTKIQNSKFKVENEDEENLPNQKSEMDEENVRDIFEMEFDSLEDWMTNELTQLRQKFKTNAITMNIGTPKQPQLDYDKKYSIINDL